MLNFTEYTKNKILAEALKTPVASESSTGGKTSHRGFLNEISYVHAIERYLDLLKKNRGNHEKAIRALAGEKHLGELSGTPYSERIKNIKNAIGKEETDRTLWDSHQAAVALINHIHKTEGGVAGPAVWTGPDTSGETVRKLTGVNTNADILIPAGSGKKIRINHGSLKYNQDIKDSPTKLYQGTARQAVKHIQDHHIEHFGKPDAALNSALEQLESSFGDVGERLEKHAKHLNAAGIQRSKNNRFSSTNVTKLARYADTTLDEKQKPEERARTRAKLEAHFRQNKVPKSEWNTHIKNLSNIYNNTIKGDKVKAARDFSQAFTNALDKSFTKAKSGQHELVTNLLNINKKAKVMVVKTQRNIKANHKKDPVAALPKVSFAVHSNDIDRLLQEARKKKISEGKMYRQVKDTSKENASSTIATASGNKIASTSIDTSKGSPSLVIQAGKFENFNDISRLHPLHPNYSSTAVPEQAKPTSMYHPSHGGKLW